MLINPLKETKRIKKPYTPKTLFEVDDYRFYSALFDGKYPLHYQDRDEWFYVLKDNSSCA